MLERIDRILPLPYPHFMGFAPLDVWWGVLVRDRAWAKIPARYWVRVLGGLSTSALATAVTGPERVVMGVWWLVRERGGPGSVRGSEQPVMSDENDVDRRCPSLGSGLCSGPLFVLGYYRSGTTHLHYLLSCDPGLCTPRWYQMLAPQGFAVSWGFLRYFLVPFLSSTRPQDDVAYGPEYPAEDDFGVCNWSGACAMPGRMVVPRCWEFYRRFQGLSGLSGRERARFVDTQRALTWKLGLMARGRRLLLKTPSHTARVADLAAIYPGARFIHLHRDPAPVLRSNVAMHRRFAPFLLQPHVGDAEVRRRVIEEYDATERAFLRDAAELGAGRVARMRYEDLIADPLGEVRRAYAALGLEYSGEFEGRAGVYLETVRGYRAAGERKSSERTDEREAIAGAPELAWMHEAFGHDRPVAPKGSTDGPCEIAPPWGEAPQGGGTVRGHNPGYAPLLSPALAALVTALFCQAVWLAIAGAARNRLDVLAWPAGVVIGMTALRAAGAHGRRGSAALGVWSLALTLAVILATAYPATWLAVRQTFSPDNLAHHVWLATRRGLLAWNNLLWVMLGLTTAYRYASREHVRPPGL